MSRLLRAGLFARAVLFTAAVHSALFIVLIQGFSWFTPPKRGGEPISASVVFARDIGDWRAEDLREREGAARAAQLVGEALARQKEERRAAEKLAQQKRAEEKKAKQKQLAEQRKAERAEQAAREAEEARKRAEAEKERKAEAARRGAAEDALSALIGRIAAKVERNWRRPQTSRAGLRATIRVRVARDGSVTGARVTRGSGDPFFDQSAERAVLKASPLPFPQNPQYYEFIDTFDFKFHPDAS
ncbi:MAG: cell envelope integrity protein TolA [Gammaproteobacteria bacterium]|nr:cell envelope integrity protein TolA [Gammaproteobacteria bacterium]